MKKILVITMLIFTTISTKASHMAGMDLAIINISSNTYRVVLSFYRDCSGVTAQPIVNFSFSSATNPGLNFTATGSLVSGTGQIITNNCLLSPSTCNGGSSFGAQLHVYDVIVTLPPAPDWVISYSLCCRNSSHTIQSPTLMSAYIEATLDNLHAPANSSPVFQALPVLVLACNTTQHINFNCFDIDGDSLTYQLVTPYNNGPGSYITWIPPSSAQQPFPSNPPMSLDPQTGILTVTPTVSIVSPMAVLVEEWRNIGGVPTKIGSILRDIQIIVDTAGSSLTPVAGGIDFQKDGYQTTDTLYNIIACQGDQMDFNIYGYDPDVPSPAVNGDPHAFTFQVLNGLPGSTITQHDPGTDSAYLHVFWAIDSTISLDTVYGIFVRIMDHACPYSIESTALYTINTKAKTNPNMGSDIVLFVGDTITIHAGNSITPAFYKWYIDSVPQIVPITSSGFFFDASAVIPGTHTLVVACSRDPLFHTCIQYDTLLITIASVSINNQFNDNLWQFYPNPFSSQITIKGTSDRKGKVEVKIITGDGRCVFNKQYIVDQGTFSILIDKNIASLHEGLYFFHLKVHDKLIIRKYLKINQ